MFDQSIEISKNIKINKYTIKLVDSKELLYRLIYDLNPVELEVLKVYIEIYLKIQFIQFLKLPIEDFILFNKKSNNSFYLYINYWSFNNLIFKN